MGGAGIRPAAREPSPTPVSEEHGQVDKSSPTAPTAHSVDIPSPGIKSGLVESSQLQQASGLEARTEQVLLLQNLTLAGSEDASKRAVDARDSEVKDRVIMPADLHDGIYHDDDEQSSPGEFTPGSEPSECWQESEDERDIATECDTILQLLNTPFQELFETWLEGIRDNNGGQGASSTSKPAQKATDNTKRSDSKRKRADDSDEQDNSARRNGPGSAGKKRRKTMPLDTQLACPYFKKDPRRHKACCGFGGLKISYVKQHLGRNHNLPLHCPVCISEFADERSRDEHIRARSCEQVENHQAPDGITLEQRLWLSKRGPSNLSDEQQWYRIFEYLFPGHRPPRSPYNDTTFSEEFHDFRDFLSQPIGLDMLLGRLRQNPNWTAENEELFAPDIGHGLGHLYWLWVAARQGESDQAPPADNHIQDSQSTSTPATSEEVRQAGSETRGGPATYEDQGHLSVSTPENRGQPQNVMADVESDLDRVAHSEIEPVAVANEQEQRKPDDEEKPDEGGEPSSIALTRIRHGQPRTSLTGLDHADNELFDLFGDGTQVDLGQADLGLIHSSLGYENDALWPGPSIPEMDDAWYIMEGIDAPREDDNSGSLGGPSTGTRTVADSKDKATDNQFGDFDFIP